MSGRARVLFVDDVQDVLDGLAGSVWRYRKSWQTTFALGGATAVAEVRASAYDVVVTDMRMPVVDGEAVLNAAAIHSPATIRIILSGQVDRAVAMRTTSVAHRFLSKPCRIDELYDCVDEVLRVATAMEASMRRFVCGIGELPIATQPAEARSHEQLVAAATRDAGLAAQLLRVASNGFFGKRRRVTSVRDAVVLLGVDTVRMLIGSITATSAIESDWTADTMSDAVGRIATCGSGLPLDHVAVGRNLLALWGVA